MHELSLAMSIVEIAAEVCRDRGGRARTINVRIGPLSGVVPSALQSAFQLAREQEETLAQAELAFEETPLVIRCSQCDENVVATFPELICPHCNLPSANVVSGRELEVTTLEIET
jgi:hydrogenase nickel incorporation protein HypA/HybF